MEKIKNFAFVLIFIFSFTANLFAGNDYIEKGNVKTTVDGKINESEYTYTYHFKELTLYLNWSGDRVYIGAKAKSTGWIGVGVGSNRMDGAHIIIGYYDEEKGPVLSEQIGVNRTHRDTEQKLLVDWGMREDNGITSFELEFKESSVIETGATSIHLITAYGSKDSIKTYHGRLRTPLNVPLKY